MQASGALKDHKKTALCYTQVPFYQSGLSDFPVKLDYSMPNSIN
jgi:hypothetical protein